MEAFNERVSEGLKNGAVRPFSDLSSAGLLWLINRVVFHPRGFALVVTLDATGAATGWEVVGDGKEVWQFLAEDEDAELAKVEAFLASIKGKSA